MGFGGDTVCVCVCVCVSTFGDIYLNIPEPDSAEQSRYLRYQPPSEKGSAVSGFGFEVWGIGFRVWPPQGNLAMSSVPTMRLNIEGRGA